MQTLWQDLRVGLRMLVKNPGFTLIAALTLTIVAKSGNFSVSNRGNDKLPSSSLMVGGQAQQQKGDFSELEKLAQAELADRKIPGAALAIVSGDRVIYAKGFGVTNDEYPTAVTTDTLFMIGSTTKLFTATALVDLAESSKPQLDDPIGKLIPGLGSKLAQVTA